MYKNRARKNGDSVVSSGSCHLRHLEDRNAVYSANEAKCILPHACLIQRRTRQSLYSDGANKFIDVRFQALTAASMKM
jgi:hypothetical protein